MSPTDENHAERAKELLRGVYADGPSHDPRLDANLAQAEALLAIEDQLARMLECLEWLERMSQSR